MRSSWMQLTAGLPIAVDIKFMLAQPPASLRTDMEPLLKVFDVAPAALPPCQPCRQAALDPGV